MTEAEWQSSSDPQAMLAFLGNRQENARKLRLFAAACSRRVWDDIDALGRAAVEVAESFADGLLGPLELRAARLACKGAGGQAAWYAAATSPAVAARNAAHSARSRAASDEAERLVQAGLLRDMFLPFRTAVLDPNFLEANGAALALAQAIYDERNGHGALDHARLSDLADVLERTGCTHPDLLAHCRAKGLHMRGCWAIDSLCVKS